MALTLFADLVARHKAHQRCQTGLRSAPRDGFMLRKLEPAVLVNRTDLADLFGVAKTTVDQWLRDGCPCRGGGGRGVERKFDSAEVHRWLVDRALAEPDPKSPTTTEGEVSHHEALRRKELANGRLAELALAEEMAAVAPVDTLKRIVGEEVGAATAMLREIPAKLMPEARRCARTPERAKRMVEAFAGLIEEALSEIKVA